MQKLKERRIQVISRNGQIVASQEAPRRTFSFFGLFSSSKSNSPSHSVLLKESSPKAQRPLPPKTDLAAVQSWVAMEERIVHDYKAQKAVPVKPVVVPAKQPVQEKAPVFETLSIQTVTSVPSFPEKVQKSSQEEKRSFFRLGTTILALGWLLAGFIAFFYAGEVSLRQDITLKLAKSQGENGQLEKSVATLKATASEQRGDLQKQRGELQELHTQVRTLSGELGAAQSKAAAYTAMEKSYRDELLRVTAQYEEQIDSMRKLVLVRDELVKTLQTHVQAIDKLVTEGGLATAFSAAVKAMEDQKSQAAEKARTALQQPPGEVVMVNRPYQFIVINLGADQGAITGGLINIFQDGKPLAKGRLERVYPSMSAVTVLDENALGEVKEGDRVSFSLS